eukprot:976252-Prorocentrum_minimum.AAC.2
MVIGRTFGSAGVGAGRGLGGMALLESRLPGFPTRRAMRRGRTAGAWGGWPTEPRGVLFAKGPPCQNDLFLATVSTTCDVVPKVRRQLARLTEWQT